MRVRKTAARWLTRGYARTLAGGGVQREEKYQAQGTERTVFWVDAPDWPLAGQWTPFGTIILNKGKLDNAPEELVDYVFLHEVGHSQIPYVLSLGSLVIRLPLLFLALIGLPYLLVWGLSIGISNPDAVLLATLAAAILLVSILILAPLILISWLDEGYAELYVVSTIGETAYRRCHQKKDRHMDASIVGRALNILYPPRSLVIKIGNRRDG